MGEPIENPILNSPYDPPDRHHVIGPTGPTGEVKDGRRPSESFIPIASIKKGKLGKDDSEQAQIDFDATGERHERNPCCVSVETPRPCATRPHLGRDGQNAGQGGR